MFTFFGEFLTVTWSSFLLHLILTCLVCWMVHHFVFRHYFQKAIRAYVPFVFGFFVSFYYMGHSFVGAYQNKLVNDFNQVRAQQAQAEREQRVQASVKVKEEFLKSIDQMVQNPQLITKENKEKLSKGINEAFGGNNQWTEAGNSIFTAFACQKFFLKDALEAQKSKKFVKSEDRAKCENYDGSFFNREKLVTADQGKGNDTVIRSIASQEKVPFGGGEPKKVTEDMLQENLKKQDQLIENLKQIFQ